MRYFLFILYLIFQLNLSAQDKKTDTIKIKLVAGKEVIKAATIFIKDSNPPSGTMTDINGLATLVIPSNLKTTTISFLGPYIELEIIRPVDSIYFDINSRRAIYYLNKRKVKSKKQIVIVP